MISLRCKLGRHRWSDWVPIWGPLASGQYRQVRIQDRLGEQRRCLRCGLDERVRKF